MTADTRARSAVPAANGSGWQFYDREFTLAPSVPLRRDGSTALLIVDMQYHDASRDGPFNRAIERLRPGSLDEYQHRVDELVVPTIAQLQSYFRANAMPVVFLRLGSAHRDYRDFPRISREMTLELEQRSGIGGILWAEDPGAQILAELAPIEGEASVWKRSAGGFATSDIDSVLRGKQVTSLVVVGVTTSCCVESTAREAADRGYGVVLVADGCAEYDQAAHEATLRTFHANFGRVVAHAVEIEKLLEEGSRL